MKNTLLLGLWRFLLPVPPRIWNSEIARSEKNDATRLAFMSDDHHRVRDFVVSELPRAGGPLPPDLIARCLNLPIERVVAILDELEKHKTFLFRNPQGEVAWAYPVTVDPTPHHITFSTGEQVHAAGAVDAIATPFVQGQLRREPIRFTIDTRCAHCGRPIQIEIDSQLQYRVIDESARPLIFSPMVDFDRLADPSIIDAFGRKSVFFWSEEHAKEYRKTNEMQRGTYLTLDQAVYVTPHLQGALFAFPREK